MTIVIGLTGGIGSGKSTVARLLADLGAAHIDADQVGHEAFKSGTPAYRDVVEAFGTGILTPTGEVDRKKLGQIVFDDPIARYRLNMIMWSRIWEMIASRVDELRKLNVGVVVVEAFGLIEAGWTRYVDQVWVTVASEKAVIERLKQGRHLEEKDILARVRSQMSNEERSRHADVIIQNDGVESDLRTVVKQSWDRVLRDASPGMSERPNAGNSGNSERSY
jgi:dephospho-CoA kinase